MKSNDKRKVLNAIYSLLHKSNTNRLYNDESWLGVNEVHDVIDNALVKMSEKMGVGFTSSLWVENGGYNVSRDGLSHWKSYEVGIYNDEDMIIRGQINCHAAGTVDDPFGRYDMSVVLSVA